MADIFDIAGRINSTSQEKVVTTADQIKDETQNKKQNVINADVARHETEIHGTGGIDSRLTDVEQMEQIVIDGGDAQIATGADFTNPDATKRAKVPTVGAIVDGLNDGVYDVSKRNPIAGPNSDGKFTLDYILDNANTLIPTGWRHGGMTISFVHTSDNKYVQYRCTADEFTTDATKWQGVDGKLTPNSHNLIESGVVYDKDARQDFELGDTISGSYNTTAGTAISDSLLSVKVSIKQGEQFFVKLTDQNSVLDNKGTLRVVYEGSSSYTALDELSITAAKGGKTYTAENNIEEISFIVTGPRVVGSGEVKLSVNNINGIAQRIIAAENNIQEETERAEGAEQTLQHQITPLQQVASEYADCLKNVMINSSDKWVDNNNYTTYFIPVNGGDTVKIESGDYATDYGFLTEYVLNDTAKYAGGASGRTKIQPNSTVEVTAPNDATLFFIYTVYGKNEKAQPKGVSINGHRCNELYNDVTNLNSNDADINEKIGDIKTTETNVSLSWSIGGVTISGTKGYAITVSSSTGYRHAIIPCSAGERYKVNLYNTASTDYWYYVVFTDANDITIERTAVSSGVAGYQIYNVKVPVGATKMYITNGKGSDTNDAYVHKITTHSLQEQINNVPSTSVDSDLSEESTNPVQNKVITRNLNNISGDAGTLKIINELDDLWQGVYLDNQYNTGEQTAENALKTKVNAHDSATCLKIAVCSDTHHGGAYATNSQKNKRRTAERVFRSFDRIADAVCDAAIHCGDISTDYGLDKWTLLGAMRSCIERFTHGKGFFITKGNHDMNENTYEEVSFNDIDFSNNTYYHKDNTLGSVYSEVTESAWRGEQLYKYKVDKITDKQFRNVIQKYKCPTSVVWGGDAYYYYDFADYKIRLIVLNSFPVNDNKETVYGDMIKWFAEIALTFTSEQITAGWSVIAMQHLSLTQTSSAVRSKLVTIINAFKNGTSTSNTQDGISYSKDFSIQGNGTFIALIHGHEHSYTYDNSNGVNDVGFTWSNCTVSELGDSANYGISVLTIDTANRKIYDDQIGGTTREYDY